MNHSPSGRPQDIDFPLLPAEVYRRVARRELVLRRVAIHALKFRHDFPVWLESNMQLWESFEDQANAVWSRGRKHYSSRTLWEVMRHETNLREDSGDFKINNNFAPDVARLYLLMYPERGGFFETRGREGN